MCAHDGEWGRFRNRSTNIQKSIIFIQEKLALVSEFCDFAAYRKERVVFIFSTERFSSFNLIILSRRSYFKKSLELRSTISLIVDRAPADLQGSAGAAEERKTPLD